MKKLLLLLTLSLTFQTAFAGDPALVCTGEIVSNVDDVSLNINKNVVFGVTEGYSMITVGMTEIGKSNLRHDLTMSADKNGAIELFLRKYDKSIGWSSTVWTKKFPATQNQIKVVYNGTYVYTYLNCVRIKY